MVKAMAVEKKKKPCFYCVYSVSFIVCLPTFTM